MNWLLLTFCFQFCLFHSNSAWLISYYTTLTPVAGTEHLQHNPFPSQVCGTDGITYDNQCLLKSRSFGARRDYRGECEPDDGDDDGLCVRVSRARRCAYNASNCRRRVRPEEGCCALCGTWMENKNVCNHHSYYAEERMFVAMTINLAILGFWPSLNMIWYICHTLTVEWICSIRLSGLVHSPHLKE